MILKEIQLENFTVFERQTIRFSPGVNLFLGNNGCGKTHLLKVLYAACQSDGGSAFPHKLVRTMLPDDGRISRLITRKQGKQSCLICVTAGAAETGPDRILTASFSERTKKWDAAVCGEEEWRQSFAGAGSVFIPANEILSQSRSLSAAAAAGAARIDDTCLDLLRAAKAPAVRDGPSREALLKTVQEMVGGTVAYDEKRDAFYRKRGSAKQECSLLSEGACKMGLLQLLIRNGSLREGSVLFWDAPEAGISPSKIAGVVSVLLELQRSGVQVFLATHSYLLASYFAVRRTDQDNILYHALYHETDSSELRHAVSAAFDNLEGNTILTAYNRLLDEVYYL